MKTTVRTLATVVGSALLACSGIVAAPPAEATVTRLCLGYKSCADAGMGARGYAKANGTMYWRMYSGHNCTNYAAYRMIRSGMPNVRPWEGGGNATYWGTFMSQITDSTPRVGAIAWWKANVSPAGSSGHVAYVEEVVSPTEIIVSQDSWGGDFSWARITKTSSGWPSGFVHFNDATLDNTAPPGVTGTAKVGSTLTASAGSWKPGKPELSYQWRAGKKNLDGANGTTLTVSKDLLGKRLKVRVTATKPGYPESTIASEKTPEVLPGALTNSQEPAVVGDPTVDSTVTVSTGTWTPQPDSVSYQWLADGEPVPGATDTSLDIGAGLVGKTLSVRTSARREGYENVEVTSAATAPVRRGTLTVSAAPTIDGELRLGETLTLTAGSASPKAVRTVQWLRAGEPVPGATEMTYPVTADDLGSRIVAQVKFTRDGYTTVTATTPRSARAKSVSELDVETKPGTGRLKVTATVSAKAMDEVRSVILVRSRGEVLGEAELTNGTATVRLDDLKAGKRNYRVVVVGTRSTTRVHEIHRLRVE